MNPTTSFGIITAYIHGKIDVMDTYTMTFVYDGELGMEFSGNANTIEMFVLEMLQKRKFILADFNWSGCYDPENVKSYLTSPYCYDTVMEIRLLLNINEMPSREAIYNCCLTALRDHQLILKNTFKYGAEQCSRPQSILQFDQAA